MEANLHSLDGPSAPPPQGEQGFGDSMFDLDCPEFATAPVSVAIDESCEVTGTEVGGFEPVVEWFDDTPNLYIAATPVVGNLNDDNGDGFVDARDIPDIVITEYHFGTTWVYSGDGSGILWSQNGYVNPTNITQEPATPAIGDLDGDGQPEVVVGGPYGIFALDGETGGILWEQREPPTAYIWNEGTDHEKPAITHALSCGALGIFDLEADGKPEVVIGNIILNGQTGEGRGGGEYGRGSGWNVHRTIEPYGALGSIGVAADLDLDGQMEVVVGNALYNADGETLWHNGEEDGFVGIGNFDADDFGEVVVTSYPGELRLQNHDGSIVWKKTHQSQTMGPPTIGDFDGDGEPEIGVSSKNFYRAFDTDGTLMWQQPTRETSSGFTGSSVFDFEGDGLAELVYADEEFIYIFDGATGTIRMKMPHRSPTGSEYPVIADVDGDGSTEIVVPESEWGGRGYDGLQVIGDLNNSWQPARPIWNQHGYSITNVSGNGEIPVSPEPNWLTYNNFRSGDLTAATGGATSDAVPILVGTCTIDCDEDWLTVVIQVGNAGVEDLPPGVPVSLYSVEHTDEVFLDSKIVSEPIPSGGSSTGLSFKIQASLIDRGHLKVVVDDHRGMQTVGECHEDNNALSITEGLCQ